MNFRVGQKVVCVDPIDCLSDKGTYTIDGTRVGLGTGKLMLIVDCCCRHRGNGWQGSYYADRFRPVVERKTDTGFAILTEILNRESDPELSRQETGQ